MRRHHVGMRRSVTAMLMAALIGLPALAKSQAAPSHRAFWATGGLGIGAAGSVGAHLAGWFGTGKIALGLATSQEGASKHRRYATGLVMAYRPELDHTTFVIGGGLAFVGGCNCSTGNFAPVSSTGTRWSDRGAPMFVSQWTADFRRAGIGASVMGVPFGATQLTWTLTFRFGASHKQDAG